MSRLTHTPEVKPRFYPEKERAVCLNKKSIGFEFNKRRGSRHHSEEKKKTESYTFVAFRFVVVSSFFPLQARLADINKENG